MTHLIASTGPRTWALPLSAVREVMRPLPVEPVADTPAYVLGVARIRGENVPVVSLASLLGEEASPAGRFVVLRVDGRSVALAVDAVPGACTLTAQEAELLPPLLSDVDRGRMEAIRRRDDRFLFVLDAARLVPHEALEPIFAGGPVA